MNQELKYKDERARVHALKELAVSWGKQAVENMPDYSTIHVIHALKRYLLDTYKVLDTLLGLCVYTLDGMGKRKLREENKNKEKKINHQDNCKERRVM